MKFMLKLVGARIVGGLICYAILTGIVATCFHESRVALTWPDALLKAAKSVALLPVAAEWRARVMCSCVNVEVGSHANAIVVPIPPHMKRYRQSRIADGLSPLIGLDRCIAEEVQYLWTLGIVTYGSCCGHNKDEATIVVAPDDHQKMLDLGYRKSADGPWFVARGVATDSAEGTRG